MEGVGGFAQDYLGKAWMVGFVRTKSRTMLIVARRLYWFNAFDKLIWQIESDLICENYVKYKFRIRHNIWI